MATASGRSRWVSLYALRQAGECREKVAVESKTTKIRHSIQVLDTLDAVIR